MGFCKNDLFWDYKCHSRVQFRYYSWHLKLWNLPINLPFLKSTVPLLKPKSQFDLSTHSSNSALSLSLSLCRQRHSSQCSTPAPLIRHVVFSRAGQSSPSRASLCSAFLLCSPWRLSARLGCHAAWSPCFFACRSHVSILLVLISIHKLFISPCVLCTATFSVTSVTFVHFNYWNIVHFISNR